MKFEIYQRFMNTKLVMQGKKFCMCYPGIVGLIASTVVPIVLLTVILYFPAPPPLISLEIDSEYITYRVSRPEIAGIIIEQAAFRTGNWECSPVENNTIEYALLEPTENSLVTYRYNGDDFIITLDAHTVKNRIYFNDGEQCVLPDRISFLMKRPQIKQLSARPLPIAGPGQIGTESGKPTLKAKYIKGRSRRPPEIMLGGELRVYGRTANPLNRGTPYPAENGKFPLPVGGRLISGPEWRTPAQKANEDAWYGVAVLRDQSMHLSITTESNNLLLFRPGRSKDSEKFQLSVFARLFDDPSIAPISLLILFISISMQAFCSWISIWRKD